MDYPNMLTAVAVRNKTHYSANKSISKRLNSYVNQNGYDKMIPLYVKIANELFVMCNL